MRIVPPCHPRMNIRNINSVMRMTHWMTRESMTVKTRDGVEKNRGDVYQSECGSASVWE